MKKIIIAIDGFSSTGKSTLAKEIAKKLKYIYVDSGAMYRAVTLHAIESQIIGEDSFDKYKLIEITKNLKIEFKFGINNQNILFVNGKKVDSKIRSMAVSNLVSKVAALPEIRKCLVKEQRRMGLNKGIVMDGRDIGTVVFPDAELKIFMTASAEIRAQRRLNELIQLNSTIEYDEVYNNINERDLNDTSRKDSPLIMSDNAIVLDNSKLSIGDQFKLVMSWVNAALS
tara:strand:+ start:236 stop:919 length:684 start_codon:yes stop_codon:yes gene_type:complete